MEKKLVEKPESLDNLLEMNEIIYYVSINHPMFKNRKMTITNWTKGIDVIHEEIKIPDDQIICDICNWNIALEKPEKIPLLCELNPRDKSETIVKKALCQKCVDKYYPNLICVGKPK